MTSSRWSGPSDEIEPLLRDHDQPQAPVDADCPWRARHLRRAPQPRSDSPPVTAWFPPLRSGVAIRPPAGLPRDQSGPPRGRRRAARRRQPLSHARPGRTRIASPNAPWIAAPLTTHPGGRVVVPGVLAVAKYPGRRAQANRSALPLDSGQNRPILRRQLLDGHVQGPAVHDARVAAICIGHGVRELLTADRDYDRFPSLRRRNPLVAPS